MAAHTIRISILALLLSLPLSASAQDGPALDDVVNGLQAFYEKTDSFKADFTQEVKRRYKPGEGVKRSGTVYFMKPGKMRWDYKTPEPVYYVSDGETLWVYEPRENVAYRGDIKGSRMASTMKFLFGAGKLRDEFEITMGEAPSEGTIALEMMPRNGEQGYKKLVLVVDAKTYEIRESRLTDPADDTSTIAFSGQTYAPIKNPEWFTWKPSDGVRIEDLSKLRE